MPPEPDDTNPALQSYLARYRPFGGWTEAWLGVPLEFHTYLAGELPPRSLVGSVRAVVLRGDKVLLVHDPAQPVLVIGGRPAPGESLDAALIREVAEESGWLVSPVGMIGFIHARHLDDQRPAWGRPAPDFIDLVFVARAESYNAGLLGVEEHCCEFVLVQDVERLGIEEINRTFLHAAERKYSGCG